MSRAISGVKIFFTPASHTGYWLARQDDTLPLINLTSIFFSGLNKVRFFSSSPHFKIQKFKEKGWFSPTFWPLLADNDCGFFTAIIRVYEKPEELFGSFEGFSFVCVKAHHHYHSIIIKMVKLLTFDCFLGESCAIQVAAWVVLMDFFCASGTINDHYFFFTSHEIQKKKLEILTRVFSWSFGLVFSIF